MSAASYMLVAQIRARELKTRIALALIIGLTALWLAPSIWPVVWFAAVVASQGLDWLVFRPLRRENASAPSPAYRAVCCGMSALAVVIYSAISVYFWFRCGEAGRLFAMVQLIGALLHVSLHMQAARSLLWSAVIPHSLYLFGLPIAAAVLEWRLTPLAAPVAGVLYLMHLFTALRQNSATTKALQSANMQARDERRKAEVASAAKSDFLAVISHEIRTPMNAVISAANLLRRTRLDAEQREHVSMLLDAGDVLVGLLNDVLDFSKIEAGRMTLESAEMDLRDKLASLRRLWEPKAAANGVRLVLEIDPDAPRCVRTDPLRFQQILFNLLSNAVKFTREGRIEVRVDWNAAAGRLTVSVADSGCGIPAERLARVFDSFEQADAGTTRRYGGTGLGLAISRRLAELMGGELTAESAEGRGSTFTLSLPVEAVDAAAQAKRPVAAGHGLKGRSILAADDHEVNRRILSLLLQPHGCRLTLVENGAEAVEAAAVERFDAILMDMQMPVMDGLEATRRIREHGANADTPILALTANAMDVHRAAWDEAGVAGFLTKPIDPELLARTLAEACAQNLQTAKADAA